MTFAGSFRAGPALNDALSDMAKTKNHQRNLVIVKAHYRDINEVVSSRVL